MSSTQHARQAVWFDLSLTWCALQACTKSR